MKRIIATILVAVCLTLSVANCGAASLSVLESQCRTLENRKNDAHEMAEAARRLNFSEDHVVITTAKEEWHKAHTSLLAKRHTMEQMKVIWQQKKDEYPAAAYIWEYFSNLGYNDYVIAGIMGNIMGEVGGNTLDIQYWLYGRGYYGMCQWSRGYSEIWGKGLEEQCDFLRDTIKYEMDTYGRLYRSGFNYESFLALQNEREAALAFAKCYERGAAFTHATRVNNSTKALNYFSF